MSITYDLIIIVDPRDNMGGKTEQISKTTLSVLMNILLQQTLFIQAMDLYGLIGSMHILYADL